MTNELEPLKECPFCGGEARLVKNEGLLSYVNCTICNASTGFDDARGAVKTWNTRYKRTCGEHRGFIPCDQDNFGNPSFTELWCEHCDIELDPDWKFCPLCAAEVVDGD